MAFSFKLISPLLLLFIISLSGCSSPPAPSGDRLVSVSWVNRNPATLRQIQTRVCGRHLPILLESLEGYSEEILPLDLPLYDRCKISVQLLSGSENISLGVLWLEEPLRRSPQREYNLRIQISPDQPLQASLEPAHLARARLE